MVGHAGGCVVDDGGADESMVVWTARNPNSYAGYLWTLGRYDRPWPERPIYGKVRSMSSDRTMSKVRVKRYLARYAEHPTDGPAATGKPAPGQVAIEIGPLEERPGAGLRRLTQA